LRRRNNSTDFKIFNKLWRTKMLKITTKQLVLSTAIALSTTVNAVTSSELIANNKVTLTAFGVVDYYTYNCAGLTAIGQRMVMKQLYSTKLNQLTATQLMNTDEFRKGFITSARYTCNSLRSQLTDAGVGPFIR
jgi:hypothetical protein